MPFIVVLSGALFNFRDQKNFPKVREVHFYKARIILKNAPTDCRLQYESYRIAKSSNCQGVSMKEYMECQAREQIGLK